MLLDFLDHISWALGTHILWALGTHILWALGTHILWVLGWAQAQGGAPRGLKAPRDPGAPTLNP